MGNWIAYVADEEDRPVAGRWLLRVLSELVDVPDGEKSQWLLDTVREITGYDTPAGRRFPCPCCDFLTLAEPPTGTFAICPVCRWEDDNVQFEDPRYEGGANRVSLSKARENYRLYGWSKPRARSRVRPPLPEEHPPREH